jgi:Bacteriophage baseplate protein W
VSRPLTWPLLPTPGHAPDEHKTFGFPTLDESVRQMIRIILLTRPGEQLMRPEFGAGIGRFLHEPNTVETRRAVRELVLQSLERWETRIALDDVEVREVDGAPTQVRIDVLYQLRRTGERDQVALTMTLGG